MKNLTYIAAPYSDPDPEIRRRRFELATEYAARLLSASSAVFSPLTHGHPFFEFGVGFDWRTFRPIDESILYECCSRMVVLRLPGWEKSEGVEEEMAMARRCAITISFVDYCEQCQLFISQFTVHVHGEIPAEPFDAEELALLRQKMRQYGEGSQSPPAKDLARLMQLESQERELQRQETSV